MSDNPADSLRREPEVVAATLAEQLDREAKEFADSELPNSQYARWLMARVTALEAALEAARADERERAIQAVERVDDGWTSQSEREVIAGCIETIRKAAVSDG